MRLIIARVRYISTSLATWGSSWVSKEAKFIKDFDFLGFSCCFSLKIEKTSKHHPKMTQFGGILDVFEYYSILAQNSVWNLENQISQISVSGPNQYQIPMAKYISWRNMFCSLNEEKTKAIWHLWVDDLS